MGFFSTPVVEIDPPVRIFTHMETVHSGAFSLCHIRTTVVVIRAMYLPLSSPPAQLPAFSHRVNSHHLSFLGCLPSEPGY